MMHFTAHNTSGYTDAQIERANTLLNEWLAYRGIYSRGELSEAFELDADFADKFDRLSDKILQSVE